MKQNPFEVFFIRSLPIKYLNKTLASFFKTLPEDSDNIDFTVVYERSQREETLNYILSLRNKNKDIFIVADDIIFRKGWYEALNRHYTESDIFGFAMLYLNSAKIQDFGYDFITIDGNLTYRGLYKNTELEHVKIPAIRQCDAINGCAMYIKKDVFKKVNSFSLDGNNRIGEMIFTRQAYENGFKTSVLGTFLYHEGISTKQKKDIKLSSISWLYEKEKWEQNVKKYFMNVIPKKNYTRIISPLLKSELVNAKKVLIYGCGTVADFIIRQAIIANFDICSGLEEEVNKMFHGKRIMDVRMIDTNNYEKVLLTAVGYEEKIINLYFSEVFFPEGKVIKFNIIERKDKIIFDIKR